MPSWVRMLLTIASLTLLACSGAPAPTSAPDAEPEPTATAASPDPADPLDPYVSFLRQGHRSPIEYLLYLFERHDLVILCERYHGELKQYDLLYALAAEPRFQAQVGTIYTEVGTRSMAPYLQEMMKAPLGDAELHKRLMHLYRNLNFMTYWAKHNFFFFLQKLHRLNHKLASERRIDVVLSDMPFSWKGMTPERYQAFRKSLGQRDRVMADQIGDHFDALQQSTATRKKALVIMNYRHAFAPIAFTDGGKGDNVGRYLFERMGERVANVLLHTVGALPAAKGEEDGVVLLQDGKWDAAFETGDNPSVGFDFAGSPFGDDGFDLFPYREHNARYRDVFTGYIFDAPLSEHRIGWGIAGFFGDGFAETWRKRAAIAGHGVEPSKLAAKLEAIERVYQERYEDIGSWPKGKPREQIARWLRR